MGRKPAKKEVYDLTTATARAKLSPRKAPYADRLGKAVALLCYVGVSGCTWKARTPKSGDKVIGPACMSEDESAIPTVAAGGDIGLTYEDAKAEVFDRVRDESKSAVERQAEEIANRTFGDVWASYIARCEAEPKKERALKQIHSYGKQIEPIFPLPASTTSVAELVAWRDGMVGTLGHSGRMRTIASVNKVISSLTAALNHSKSKGEWRDLGKIRTTTRSVAKRDGTSAERVVFNADQLHAFNAAVYALDPAFGLYCEALMLTGARPGELAQSLIEDVRSNKQTGQTELYIRAGKTGDRRVYLSAAGRAFFERQVQGRDPKALLFADQDGRQWEADHYRYTVKKAAAEIGIPTASLYALRHGHITLAIYASVPLTSVARNCGTSVAMIQQTYSHAVEDLEQSAFAELDRALNIKPALKVVK